MVMPASGYGNYLYIWKIPSKLHYGFYALLGHTMLNIQIFWVSVFYQVRFFDPWQTCAQEYACHMKIDAFLILSGRLHYL